MDAATIQEAFGRAVMAGCLVVSVALVAAGLALVAKRAVRWSARTVRRVGVATFLAIGILAAWATYTGTPTLQDKSDAASRREGEAETNRILGGGMLLQTTGDDGVTRSHGDTETRDGVSGASSPGEVSDAVPPSGPDLSVSVSPCDLESTPSIRPLTDADYAASFALARIGTGETWDFAPPPGAEVSDDWTRFGAARDWFRASWHVDDGAWGAGFAFPFGTNVLGALTVFSHGTARHDLTWHGRFASLRNAVNYYSSEEDVLENSDGGVHSVASASYAWMNQETRKGVWPMPLPGNNEAGWEFNDFYKVDNPYSGQGESYRMPRPPAQADLIGTDSLVVAPFFAPFDDMSICVTNRLASLPGKARLLGDAIPAESYATGRNPVPGWEERSHGNENQDMILFREPSCSGSWTHGFIKDMSYFYVQQLFLDVVRRMKE